MNLFFKQKTTLKELDLGLQMDSGAPCPVVLSDEHKVILLFYLYSSNPDWDGTTIHVRDSDNDVGVACVEFKQYKQSNMVGRTMK